MVLIAVVLFLFLFQVFARKYNTNRRVMYRKYQNVVRLEIESHFIDLIENIVITLFAWGLNFAVLYNPSVIDTTTQEVIHILPGYIYGIAVMIILVVFSYKVATNKKLSTKDEIWKDNCLVLSLLYSSR